MAQYIDKSALVAEIEKRRSRNSKNKLNLAAAFEDNYLLSFLDTLKVKDPYEQYIQYDSIKAGIQANAEIYSFNIESRLFNQLAKEQQGLWRKEIEQAYIIGGNTGVELARDIRYKENVEGKEVNIKKEVIDWWNTHYSSKAYTFEGYSGHYLENSTVIEIAKYFFELGLKAQKGE